MCRIPFTLRHYADYDERLFMDAETFLDVIEGLENGLVASLGSRDTRSSPLVAHWKHWFLIVMDLGTVGRSHLHYEHAVEEQEYQRWMMRYVDMLEETKEQFVLGQTGEYSPHKLDQILSLIHI